MIREARIAEILLRSQLVDELQLRAARAHQDQWGGGLASAVVEKGFAKEDQVVAALAEGLKVPRFELARFSAPTARFALP